MNPPRVSIFTYISLSLKLVVMFLAVWIIINTCYSVYLYIKSKKDDSYNQRLKTYSKRTIKALMLFLIIFVLVFIVVRFTGQPKGLKLHPGLNVICTGFWINDRCIGNEEKMYIDVKYTPR